MGVQNAGKMIILHEDYSLVGYGAVLLGTGARLRGQPWGRHISL
jgi:hypothetical protein